MKLTFFLAGISFILLSPIAHAVDKAVVQQPEQSNKLKETEGSIDSIDLAANKLWVIDGAQKRIAVRVTSATRILNDKNESLMLKDLNKSDKIHVYYNTIDGSARQIDRVGGMLAKPLNP